MNTWYKPNKSTHSLKTFVSKKEQVSKFHIKLFAIKVFTGTRPKTCRPSVKSALTVKKTRSKIVKMKKMGFEVTMDSKIDFEKKGETR